MRLERGSEAGAAADAITAAGAGVVERQGPVVVVSADEARLDALASLADVAWIENYEIRQKHNEYAGQTMGAPAAWAGGYDGSSQTVAVADTGLGGGTAATAHADIPATRVSAIFNWPGVAGGCFQAITNDGARDVDSGHGTHVSGSVLGDGNASGRGKGTAPAAHLVFQAVENWVRISNLCKIVYGYPDGYYLAGIPTDIRTLFQQAYDAGARMHSNSWGSGTNGDYTTDAQNADDFVWNHRDVTITFSAGNGGVDSDGNGGVEYRSLATQASAKNVLSVGASEGDRASDYACDTSLAYTACASQGGQNVPFTYGAAWPDDFPAPPLSTDPSAGNPEQMAAFSSRGPADDGRIKPDVVAPGTWILSAYSDLYQQGYDAAANPQNSLYQYDGWGFPQGPLYKYMGGTSMSNPLVAGAAAIVRDYYQKAHGVSASGALVKATLINSAVDLLDEDNDGADNNAFPIPNQYEGWGRVNLAAAVDGSRAFRDEGPTLSTGGSLSYSYAVAAGTPLKVSLVWTDPPASLASYARLVNDLDLEVVSPSGVSYKGNAFAFSSGGWTVPESGVPDRANNVENVYVQAPAAGTWTVTIRAYNVPMGPQDFALVVAGQSVEPVYALTAAPPANGTIASSDGHISCGTSGTACSHDYPGTAVTLSALPDSGYVHSGWAGDCTGSGDCIVTMDQPRSVGATFAPAPFPTLSVGDVTTAEGHCGEKEAVFTVSLSSTSGQEVTVAYSTVDGSAVAGQDFAATSGLLSFPPGVTTLPIAVPISGDTLFEADETFTVVLAAPSGALIGDGIGVGAVVNDDLALEAGEDLVTWTNAVGVMTCGADVVKTASAGWGNGGAVSNQRITSGDGYMEFTASESNTFRMIGLSNGNQDASYQDIDFAVYLLNGTTLIYEKGINRGNGVPYVGGDVFRVTVQGGVVTYSKNGTVFYTSLQTPVYPLLVDTSFYTQGSTATFVVISGNTAPPPPPPGTEAVVWTSLVGVEAFGNSLTKTASAGWGNGGAVSTQQITSGDGYVEFTASESNTFRMIGLSNGNQDASYQDIDFAVYLLNGTSLIYEKGINRGNGVPYVGGDVFRVAVQGGVVTYSKNGTVFYTSLQTPAYPLLVDTSFYTQGSTATFVVISGNTAPPPPPPGTEAVVWTSLVGVEAFGNSLTKTASAGWGNGGAVSTQQITSGDGYVEFTASESNTFRMIGLSNGNQDASYQDIDFAVYLLNGTTLIYEKGINRGNGVPYVGGDVFRVTVQGGAVTYSKNGTVFYTSLQTPVYPLLVDTSFYTQGSTATFVVISGNN